MNRFPRPLILLLTLAATAALPATAVAAPRCDGREANVVGSAESDRIVAERGDVIVALAGNDRVWISDDDVVACLGPGRDRAEFDSTTGGVAHVFGQGGRDAISTSSGDLDYAQVYLEIVADGGPGADYLFGAYAKDRLSGGRGDDEIVGNHDADKIDGGGGDDLLIGNNQAIDWVDGRNRISGGAGDDTIFGSYKDDLLEGDGGADRIKGDDGDDTADGGAGLDECDAERELACEL
jgi:Ca2+-binding RTX toxin-like protein